MAPAQECRQHISLLCPLFPFSITMEILVILTHQGHTIAPTSTSWLPQCPFQTDRNRLSQMGWKHIYMALYVPETRSQPCSSQQILSSN